MLLWLAALAAVAAACLAAPGRPTTTPVVDGALRLAFGGLLALAGSRARPWAWLVAGAAVAAAASGPVGAAAGFGTLLLTIAALWCRRTSAAVGAVVGGGVAAAALRLGWPAPFGATAGFAALAGGLLVASALRGASRRVVLLGAGALLVVAVVAVLPAVVLLRQRERITAAVEAGQDGLDAARRGDTAAAESAFQQASALVDDIDRPTRTWWSRPALAVPVVAQHLRSLDSLLDTASALAATGLRTSRAADVERLRPVDGRIDLTSLQAIDAPLRDLERSLADAHRTIAGRRSPWLVAPFTDRVEHLDRQIVDAGGDARRARRAVEALPALLGADGPRRYLLAAMTTAELRGVGGVVGNWGILVADRGAIHLETFERIDTLLRPTPYAITVDPDYDDRYVRGWGLARFPQNLLASPDLPTSARAASQVLEQAGHGRIDGMIAVDPHFMAALLRITGPVEVAGWSTALTADNAAQLLLHDQYAEGDIQDPSRVELLDRTTHALFDRLTHGSLASISTLVDVLGPTVHGRHVQVTAFDPASERFLVRSGISRRLAPGPVDDLHLVTEDSSSTKLAWYLRRSMRYDARIDPRTGATRATVTVVMRNTAPTDLTSDFYQDTYNHLPMGVEVQVVSIYSTLVASGVTVDGVASELGRATERGFNVYDRFVTLPPGGSATVVYTLRGELPVQRGAYRLDLHRQPTVAPDDLTVVVNGRTLFDGPQDRDLVLRTNLSR